MEQEKTAETEEYFEMCKEYEELIKNGEKFSQATNTKNDYVTVSYGEMKKGGSVKGIKGALEHYKDILEKFEKNKSNTIDGKFYSPNDLRYLEEQVKVLESIIEKRGDLEVGDEGMWHGGEAKIVRFEGDNLIIKRPNESKEIKISIESFSKEFAKFPKQKNMEKKPKKGLKKLAALKVAKLTKKDARKFVRTKRSKHAIAVDKGVKAKKAGKRISASGRTYYEYRESRSDKDLRKKI